MSETRKVVIFGSGLVGSQWALLYASAGFRVALYDAQEGQAARSLERIGGQLSELSAAGHLRDSLSAEQQLNLISAPASLDAALDGAFLVQECVYEDVQVKRDVFQLLDARAPADAILSSSTSCIMPSVFTGELAGRARCLVAHPINPPYFLTLVELVPSQFTDPNLVKTMKETLVQLGQEPIVINKELDGFAVNRLQYAIINEAWRLVSSGAMSAEDVDKSVTCALGSIALMQTNANGIRDYCRRYGVGMSRFSATFGSTPTYQGAELDRLAAQMDALMPLESLSEACRRRDRALATLALLRNQKMTSE